MCQTISLLPPEYHYSVISFVKLPCFKAHFSYSPPEVFFLYMNMCENLQAVPQFFSILCGTAPGAVPSSSNGETKGSHVSLLSVFLGLWNFFSVCLGS